MISYFNKAFYDKFIIIREHSNNISRLLRKLRKIIFKIKIFRSFKFYEYILSFTFYNKSSLLKIKMSKLKQTLLVLLKLAQYYGLHVPYNRIFGQQKFLRL